MGLPMMPRPMNAIFIMVFLLKMVMSEDGICVYISWQSQVITGTVTTLRSVETLTQAEANT